MIYDPSPPNQAPPPPANSHCSFTLVLPAARVWRFLLIGTATTTTATTRPFVTRTPPFRVWTMACNGPRSPRLGVWRCTQRCGGAARSRVRLARALPCEDGERVHTTRWRNRDCPSRGTCYYDLRLAACPSCERPNVPRFSKPYCYHNQNVTMVLCATRDIVCTTFTEEGGSADDARATKICVSIEFSSMSVIFFYTYRPLYSYVHGEQNGLGVTTPHTAAPCAYILKTENNWLRILKSMMHNLMPNDKRTWNYFLSVRTQVRLKINTVLVVIVDKLFIAEISLCFQRCNLYINIYNTSIVLYGLNLFYFMIDQFVYITQYYNVYRIYLIQTRVDSVHTNNKYTSVLIYIYKKIH
jgi:hypothetical protein